RAAEQLAEKASDVSVVVDDEDSCAVVHTVFILAGGSEAFAAGGRCSRGTDPDCRASSRRPRALRARRPACRPRARPRRRGRRRLRRRSRDRARRLRGSRVRAPSPDRRLSGRLRQHLPGRARDARPRARRLLREAVRARRARGGARDGACAGTGRVAPRRGNRPVRVVILSVRSDRQPPAERGVLVVPVIPGTTLRSVEPAGERAPASARVLPVSIALGGGLALVAVAVLAFAPGWGGPHPAAPAPAVPAAAPAPAPTPVEHASQPLTPPPLTAEQRARAAAKRMAARLPVALDSTALLRVGSKLY